LRKRLSLSQTKTFEMEEQPITNPEESGIADELTSIIQYEYASTGQRFLNWLIDNLLMRFGLIYATGYAAGVLLALMAPDYVRTLQLKQALGEDVMGDLILVGAIITILSYVFYYTICEKFFKGYTLGKLITGTRVIREDGQELTFKDAILRSLSRLVPFEAFSGFALRPWHDTWTKTMVVKAR